MFALLKIRFKAVFFLNIFVNVLNTFNLRKLKNRLGIIGYRAIAVYGNRNRPHAEHTESYQTESKDCRINHKAVQTGLGGKERNHHQADHNDTLPKSREITGNDTGNNVQRSTGLTTGFDNFLNMLGF